MNAHLAMGQIEKTFRTWKFWTYLLLFTQYFPFLDPRYFRKHRPCGYFRLQWPRANPRLWRIWRTKTSGTWIALVNFGALGWRRLVFFWCLVRKKGGFEFFVCLFVCWLAGWLVGWLVCWLVDVSWSVCWVGFLWFCLFSCLLGWFCLLHFSCNED